MSKVNDHLAAWNIWSSSLDISPLNAVCFEELVLILLFFNCLFLSL